MMPQPVMWASLEAGLSATSASAMTRVRAQTSPSKMCKLLRGSMLEVPAALLRGAAEGLESADLLEDVALVDWLAEVLHADPYPSLGVLHKALRTGFALSAAEADQVARGTLRLLSYARQKRSRRTSGARTLPGLKRVLDTLDRVCNTTLGQKLKQRAAELQRSPRAPAASAGAKGAKEAPPTVLLPTSPSSPCEMPDTGGAASSNQGHKPWSMGSIAAAFGADESLVETVSSSDEEGPSDTVRAVRARVAKDGSPKVVCGRPFVDAAGSCLRRVTPEGHVERARMAKGPAGFAVATFTLSGESFNTEIPNLVVEEDPPSPAEAEDEEEEVEAKEPPEEEKEAEAKEVPPEEKKEVPPAPKKRPAAEEESTAPKKKQARAETPPPHPDFGPLRVCRAADKSYIQYRGYGDAPKYTLLVNITAKTAPNHQSLIMELLRRLEVERGLTKQDVIRMRDELIREGISRS